jgi:predicted helicase
VQLKLLTDYKVLVLTISEEHVSSRIQELLKDENNQLKVDDAARIIGCWKALSKQGLAEDLSGDAEPMRRAVAFCQVIERSNGRSHKVSSKQIASMFSAVVKAYQEQENSDNDLLCEAAHVDGSMNATEKEQKLEWIKAEPPPNTCRILSNVRCLSEGVDVPALDAVLFLTPRNSQVDVVQSVGRVMRNAPGKKRGYVILPVVIPVGMEPHEALNDNKVYKVVWQVLQALRSHDDTFDAMINKIDLTGHDTRKMEVIAITDKAQKKSATTKNASSNVSAKGQSTIGSPETPYRTAVQTDLQFEVGDLERALYAKVVKKCGNPNHWEDWANDIAKIANTHISRITQIVSNPSNTKECEAFQAFAYELRDDLNDSITDTEVIEMLAQHLITKPVFDALFEDYSFASHNPVSQAMQHVLEVLQEHRLEKEADTLEKFYASVKMRAANIHDVTAKQKIVVELYDKFFRNAFPKMTERLGIVYTPVEVVDFIIHSVNELLQQEFGQTLGSKGVHIIDPFTGTGTFITRLLQSGLISPEQLPHKYQHEIHANEIVLLAYYIAAINIEAVYHALMKGHAAASSSSQSKIQNQQSSIGNPAFTSPAPTGRKTIAQGNALGPDPTTDLSPVGATQSGIPYEPFQGICLTDTFRLGEEDLISSLLHNNSERRKRQQQLDVRVIIGNPPYSIGQASENDNAANVEYPELDLRIRQTYAEKSSAILQKGIYDSYVRAMRWASDRIGESGVIGYVTNAGFLEGATADGLRKSLVEEFSKIYVFHLRGNARTSGEQRRKERDNVFGQGTRTPIAITILVKNPQSKNQGQIYWCDIGDYLSLDEKLGKISAFVSIAGICTAGEWRSIVPDQHGDWINQRDNSFGSHIVMGSKELTDQKVFEKFSLGVVTNRDAWTTNYSKSVVTESISRLIKNYQAELSRIILSNHTGDVSNFVDSDPEKISWTRSLKNDLRLRKSLTIEDGCLTCFCYRPFTKTWRFYSRRLNEMVNSMPKCFPINSSASNLVIAITGTGTPKDFSAFITDTVPDLQLIANGQCFPLYLYEKTEASTADGDLFASQANGESYTRRDAITDAGLAHFQAAFPAAGEGSSITKEDLFYYIYGLLHSPDYRSRYADNLSKELPRIPAVKSYADFRAFEKAGSALAHWHLNYETVDCHPAIKVEIAPSAAEKLPATELYRVTKMKFAKRKDPNTGKSLNDKTTVIYNDYITLRNIPLEAYDYVVNGKPALEWVMERQSVTTDKDSGITNDANLYATETMQNPKYPLELLLRVCTVSEETNKIVASLPALNI